MWHASNILIIIINTQKQKPRTGNVAVGFNANCACCTVALTACCCSVMEASECLVFCFLRILDTMGMRSGATICDEGVTVLGVHLTDIFLRIKSTSQN